MKPYFIRQYIESDFSACVRCFRSNVPASFTKAEVKDYSDWLKKLSNGFADNKDRYFVIEVDNAIIGCGGIAIETEKQKIIFAWGFLHRKHQKQGFGKALSLFRINLIKAEYPDFDIVLDTTQHAYGFFEKLGFVTKTITTNFYAKGMDRYDMRRQ